ERTAADAPGHLDRPLLVSALDRAGQAVLGVVGDPYRVVLVVVRDDGEYRAEHLFLRDLAVGVHMRQYGRGVAVARVDPRSPGDQGRAGRDGPLDHAVDLVALSRADQRAHEGLRIGRVAVRDPGDVRRDLVDDAVVVLARDQQSRGECAALT